VVLYFRVLVSSCNELTNEREAFTDSYLLCTHREKHQLLHNEREAFAGSQRLDSDILVCVDAYLAGNSQAAFNNIPRAQVRRIHVGMCG
jgi:hypothetical protein